MPRSQTLEWASGDRCSHSQWEVGVFQPHENTYDEVGSRRRYGVEIEVDYSNHHDELHSITCFGAKEDMSVDGGEFDSPILWGDKGFDEIQKFTDFADDNGWGVDHSCGLHIHLDLRRESEQFCCRVAYAYARTLDIFWKKLVARNRRNNSYCDGMTLSAREIRSYVERAGCEKAWDYVCGGWIKFTFVNFDAFNLYETVEIRGLEGTLDGEKICKWIAAHCQFIDRVGILSMREIADNLSGSEEEQIEWILSLFTSEVADYLRRRMEILR